MRSTLLTLAMSGMLALGSYAYAQDQDNPPPPQGQWGHGPHRMDPDRELQHLTRELNLSSDQQTQIKPLLVDQQQKMEALRQDQSVAPEDRHAKAKSISDDTHSKIEALLNDDQKQKFEAMQQRMHRGPGGPPPQQ
jgi:periplasmic protein CpxP/Spy